MVEDGLCEYREGLLKVNPKLGEYGRRDALLHEIMHAILYQQGREYGGEVEESYVGPLATGLIGVLQDNPALAAWLIEPIKEKSR